MTKLHTSLLGRTACYTGGLDYHSEDFKELLESRPSERYQSPAEKYFNMTGEIITIDRVNGEVMITLEYSNGATFEWNLTACRMVAGEGK